MNSPENLAWFKSSYSGGGGGECLEVAQDQRELTLHIRDSKNPSLPHLTATPAAWAAFLNAYARR
ncbi:DUF397 domain-containing protein [Streptomyces sp. B-S-A6]|uniref:DUF397 domain-containing protein n=2 Tax=Streptomyces cavernicola TaxID=3043613 RepID=A0ABT6SB06_9ACTN|nr:DUF397 domain-containing protein [Streptomyces sp. B-S-A6]MDI3405370.1 DUF397 domain-containing protein [Streptomyces sp. B-S-A6]